MANPFNLESTATACHIVAMPYPSRGHINPMMNLCKLLVSRNLNLLITFVVTEEWHGYISSDPKPETIRFATVHNVIPSEHLKAVDITAFYEAVMRTMEAPFELLLDRLDPPVTAMIGDIELGWAIDLGNRRNIPVAAFWTMSATFFSMLCHFHLCPQAQNLPIDLIDQIPGISSSNITELQTVFRRNDLKFMQLSLECISKVPKAQYLLFTSVYELEPQEMETLRATFQFPVYSIGPAIPYLELQPNYTLEYQKWLDSQPEASVLYISLGSFLSVSKNQMDEIFSGLQDSGVRYLWVARGEASGLKEICSDKGLVLPWCDQLKVLCHSSVGAFWTHCGWNSTLEALFAGVPLLTFPLFFDQDPNNKKILEEWKIGWKVQSKMGEESLVKREEVAQLVKKVMDLESKESKEMRTRARKLSDACQLAITENGSSVKNLDAFIRNILQGN
ncbi:hypothetical protein JCGZ_18646 [Jatropha curcas]|uniref:Glycosyltransferase n=1 Tax=Jatropha curcas TaxID=180498 RepID=A0A067K0J1_JATCU|nr:UDP-glycosyltransferase 87A1 [Jatropha curcas]KDP29711.1 hypothetical protein JCGZ_18646 [Jatropha curcas]